MLKATTALTTALVEAMAAVSLTAAVAATAAAANTSDAETSTIDASYDVTAFQKNAVPIPASPEVSSISVNPIAEAEQMEWRDNSERSAGDPRRKRAEHALHRQRFQEIIYYNFD
jgi:hypothetical protein